MQIRIEGENCTDAASSIKKVPVLWNQSRDGVIIASHKGLNEYQTG